MKNKPTITIIGGSQEGTFKKIGEKKGCNILFHNGKDRKGTGVILPLVKKSDCVVILQGACCHPTMFKVKELCKELNIKIIYQNGFGASAAITNGLAELKKIA
ncbi:DUF2325 domain-containing protein [Lysinibacillus sp. NPDC093712]|uniref:DUF2325 domain-containing protein n=1 Tax=Lysinibacillus sp. NPDC093712 TaxID=3390579 RepID=UPI003D027B01